MNNCFFCSKTLERDRGRPPLIADAAKLGPTLIQQLKDELGNPPYHICKSCFPDTDINESLTEEDVNKLSMAAQMTGRALNFKHGLGEE